MATSNFINHENGVYVLYMPDFDQMKEWMLEDEFFEDTRADGITDEDVYDQLYHEEEEAARSFFEWVLKPALEKKGIELIVKNQYEAEAYRDDRIMAILRLESGYYDGIQVIVDTDPEHICYNYADFFYNEHTKQYQDEPVLSQLYRDYTPHNRTLFSVLGQVTTPLRVLGTFSNGETVYESM